MDVSRNIVVGFSSTDFYYVTAATADPSILNNCSSALQPSCGDPVNVTADNAGTCYQKEVCINKQTAEWIKKYQNKHSGSDQNYLDTKSIYNSALQRTANLGIGIFATIVYIYFNM